MQCRRTCDPVDVGYGYFDRHQINEAVLIVNNFDKFVRQKIGVKQVRKIV